MKTRILTLSASLLILASTFCFLDRYFLKLNNGFCLEHLYSSFKDDPSWTFETHSRLPKEQFEKILQQPFTYLGKGHQSYVFESSDHQYVLKFYRFPSHLRPFSFLHHPISHFLSLKRKAIEVYNEQKFQDSMMSYNIAFTHFYEESALLCIHMSRTNHWQRTITIVDKLHHSYHIPLHKTHFLLQKKGSLIFPQISELVSQNRVEDAKKLIHNIFVFIDTRMQKGILDQDAMIEKNYGCFQTTPFQLDIGRLSFAKESPTSAEIKQTQNHICESLGTWLKQNNTELYQYYIKLSSEN